MGYATVGHECPVCKATYETVGQLWAHRGDYFGLAPDECGGQCAPPRRKYGNEPTEYNGVVYHSALEAACAAELDRLAATDPPLVLKVLRQRAMRLNRTGTVRIVVDFSAVIAGHRGSIELDAKGFDTPVGKLKRAWFFDVYGVPVHVVRTPAEIEPLLRELGGG